MHQEESRDSKSNTVDDTERLDLLIIRTVQLVIVLPLPALSLPLLFTSIELAIHTVLLCERASNAMSSSFVTESIQFFPKITYVNAELYRQQVNSQSRR